MAETPIPEPRPIANSMLVKTAWAGADPNWGRVLAAVGYSGVPIDPNKVDIFFGKHQICSTLSVHTGSASVTV